MSVSRRRALKTLGAAPLAAGFSWTAVEADNAHQQATQARKAAAGAKRAFKPKFFSPHEWATVNVLVDLIIPKDERSGSATDAGVPAFMDFMMGDQPERQVAMRGGLRWLDTECRRRFDKEFVECTPAERTTLLDDIAWPARARPEFRHGVAFFSSFRDLTATGFWTTKMGIEDLQYMGNMPTDWTGCPAPVLDKLGVKAE